MYNVIVRDSHGAILAESEYVHLRLAQQAVPGLIEQYPDAEQVTIEHDDYGQLERHFVTSQGGN